MPSPRTALAALLLAALTAACEKQPEPVPAARSASEAPRVVRGPAPDHLGRLARAAGPARAPPPRPRPRSTTRRWGTHILLAAYTDDAFDEAALRGKFDKALAEIRRLEALMTTCGATTARSRASTPPLAKSAAPGETPRRSP